MLLIRHGLPIRAIKPDGTPADPPLSELGQEQARRVADWLREEAIDRIYSSPLRRARETALPLAPPKPELRQQPMESQSCPSMFVGQTWRSGGRA